MLTENQRKLRKGHLGASDMPALFGLDPFKTGVDVWMSKCFDIVEPEKQPDSIEFGKAFEAPVLDWAVTTLGVRVSGVVESLFAVCKEHPIFSATLDEKILGVPEAIEAKVTRIIDEYGEPGTDQVPDRVNIQVQAQMLVHDLQRVHVAVLMGRNGLKRELYCINRNEDIIKAIIEKGEWFWNEFVIPKKQPPEDAFGLGSLDIIKRVVRQPATWAEIPDALITDWEAKRKAKLDAEKAEEEAKARVLTPMGDAEGARLSDGRILTYYASTKRTVDQSKLKAKHPDIYNAVLRDSISRTLRIKEV